MELCNVVKSGQNVIDWLGPTPVNASSCSVIEQTLINWEPLAGCAIGLQAGDFGWLQRFGAVEAASRLAIWHDQNGRIVVVLCHDGDGVWWFAMDPAEWGNQPLAASLADWIADPANGVLSVDGPPAPAAWRIALATREFEATTELWAHLWRPLDPTDNVDIERVVSTVDLTQVPDRVAVQRSAFAKSTFTVERWEQMAEGAHFDSRFDLLARDQDGTATSAATFWFAGIGKCARLEPMATDPKHHRRGHGLRLLRAGFAELFRAGASGVSVMTPESNTAAVGLYRTAGFVRIDGTQAMVRRR